MIRYYCSSDDLRSRLRRWCEVKLGADRAGIIYRIVCNEY